MLRSPKELLPRWLGPLNRLIVGAGRLGLSAGPVHVLIVPGRRSGRPRSTPVSPLVVDGHRYVVAGIPQADWARNVRAAGWGELARGRRRAAVRLVEESDPGVKRAVMAAFPREVPGGVPLMIRLGLVDGADPAQFAAAADRVAVFEIVPGGSDTPS